MKYRDNSRKGRAYQQGEYAADNLGLERVRSVAKTKMKGNSMKASQFNDYSDLPLFLNAETVAKTLGVAPSSAYKLMHESDFPVLKVGNRMVIPKEKFIQWVEQHTQGGAQ